MKKLSLALVCMVLLNSFTFTTFAETKENVETKIYSDYAITNLELTEEGYLLDDPILQVAPNYNLSNLDIENLDSEISLLSYPSDNPDSRKLTSILKKSYTNNDIKIATAAIYNFGVGFVPTAIKKTAFYNFVNSWVNIKIISAIKPTYVATWAWETHDYTQGNHIVYNTVVHYSDSSFSKVVSCDYFEADRYPIYVNGQHYHKY